MEHSSCGGVHEHVISVANGEATSTSTSHQDMYSDSDEPHQEDRPSTSTRSPSSHSSASTSPTAYSPRNLSFPRRDSIYGQGRSIWNSRLWISFEIVIYVAQVIAAVAILVLSRDEHPHAPLFAWIIGYMVGCIASIPLIYWRYVHRNRPLDQEPQQLPTTYPTLTPSQSSEGRSHRTSGTVLHLGCFTITCPRLSILTYHFKTAVDCFFAVWFVVGNVWIFGGHSISSDAQDAPNMYRLCLAFLALSCVGYAIPFIMCAAICCCFPCLISILRLQEDLGQSRGATQELIDALPTYKFKPKRNKNWGIDLASSSENLDEGGILGPGTNKERIVSAEDAVDIRDKDGLEKIFTSQKFDAVIHFAGLKAVGESVQNPLLYYDYNVVGTINLLEVMVAHGCKKLIFSSSAAVYGSPKNSPCTEEFPLLPHNPYGRTKLMAEEICRDIYHTDPEWSIILLRYFNPVGAHPSGCLGEDPCGTPNNLMPFVQQIAVGRRPSLTIFGNNYATKDGTGVRDYIHVVDLADGHAFALRKLFESSSNIGCEAYNLGTGKGTSVLEIVNAFEKASGKKIPLVIGQRRLGDAEILFASTAKAERELNWKAKYGIQEMCRDLWNWARKNPYGYASSESPKQNGISR